MTPQSSAPEDRTPRRTGMTLVEATVAMVVVSVLMVAALNTLGASARAGTVQVRHGRAYTLAQGLMNEVLGTRYADPQGGSGLGRDAGEAADVRAAYDDVDDYNGWSASPPEDKSGAALEGATGWTRQVAVAYVDPNNPATVVGADQGLKRITVTVSDPRGRQTTLTALRGQNSIYDAAPSGGGQRVRWVGLDVQVGEESATRVYTGIALLNRPMEP